jgi:hypothetical protein
MTDHNREFEGNEFEGRGHEESGLEAYEAYLIDEYQRHAATAVSGEETNAIWNAMRAELKTEDAAESVPSVFVKTSSGSYFRFRNLFSLAALGLVFSISSVIIVAVQQRRDGTVISTVNHVERLMRRGQMSERTRHDWLPEEREIWKQLLSQAGEANDETRAVALQPRGR